MITLRIIFESAAIYRNWSKIYTLFQLCSQYRTYIIDKQDIIYKKNAQLGRTQQGATLTEVNSQQ